MKPKPTTTFKCASCPTMITCWPYKAGRAVCRPCLIRIRSTNGRKDRAPPVGSTNERRFRNVIYRVEYRPDHPDAPAGGWMMQHRLVMEQALGRRLTAEEVVHHKDRDGLNNAPDNLELISDRGAHLAQEHCMEGVAARMAGYPICACGARTEYNSLTCWTCWKKSQTCPTCGREGRKMARRDMCHGCYKNLRRAEGRLHGPLTANSGA